MPKISIILDTITVITESLVACVIIFMSAFGNVEEWEKLLNYTCDNAKKLFTLKIRVLYVCSTLLPIIIAISKALIWGRYIGYGLYHYYIFSDVVMYHAHTLINIYLVMTYMTWMAFKQLNNHLTEIIEGVQITQKITTKFPSRSTTESIRQLKASYRFMYGLVVSQNNIFGFAAVALTGYATMVILKTFYVIVYTYETNHRSGVILINAVMAFTVTVTYDNFIIICKKNILYTIII